MNNAEISLALFCPLKTGIGSSHPLQTACRLYKTNGSVKLKKPEAVLSPDSAMGRISPVEEQIIYKLRRLGAIVFSSSKGGEFSYESDKIKNGYFTEEIIKALTSKKADKNNYGTISTDELRK